MRWIAFLVGMLFAQQAAIAVAEPTAPEQVWKVFAERCINPLTTDERNSLLVQAENWPDVSSPHSAPRYFAILADTSLGTDRVIVITYSRSFPDDFLRCESEIRRSEISEYKKVFLKEIERACREIGGSQFVEIERPHFEFHLRCGGRFNDDTKRFLSYAIYARPGTDTGYPSLSVSLQEHAEPWKSLENTTILEFDRVSQ